MRRAMMMQSAQQPRERRESTHSTDHHDHEGNGNTSTVSQAQRSRFKLAGQSRSTRSEWWVTKKTNSSSYPLRQPSSSPTRISRMLEFLFWSGQNDSSEDHDSNERRVPIHPFSPFSQGWEFVSGCLLLYSAIVTPLVIAFYTEDQGFCGRVPTIGLDMLVDLFFFVEIFVHALTGRVVRGFYVFEWKRVLRLYSTQDFLPDLLCSSPVAWVEFFVVTNVSCSEWSAEESEEQSESIRYLRFIRMLKLLRLLKVLKIFNVARDMLRIRPVAMRLVKAGFSVFLIAHVGGCLYWFLKMHVDPQAIPTFRVENDVKDTMSSTYLVSIYYVMATLCTVGYGDIAAEGDAERFFSLFLMMIGASVFAIIVSNMSALATSMQSRENMVMEEMDHVLDFLRGYGISSEHERLVQSFYLFRIRQKTAFAGQLSILDSLPDALHRSIVLELNRNLLGAAWIFDRMADDEIERFVEALKLQLATPGEVVIFDDEEPHSLFIIVSGVVNLTIEINGRTTIIEKLTKGDVFGDVGVILGTNCPYRAVARDYAELYKLEKEDLHRLSHVSPKLQERLQDGAQAKMAEYLELHGKAPGETREASWARMSKLLLQKVRVESSQSDDSLKSAKDRLFKYTFSTASSSAGAAARARAKLSSVEGVQEEQHGDHESSSQGPKSQGPVSQGPGSQEPKSLGPGSHGEGSQRHGGQGPGSHGLGGQWQGSDGSGSQRDHDIGTQGPGSQGAGIIRNVGGLEDVDPRPSDPGNPGNPDQPDTPGLAAHPPEEFASVKSSLEGLVAKISEGKYHQARNQLIEDIMEIARRIPQELGSPGSPGSPAALGILDTLEIQEETPVLLEDIGVWEPKANGLGVEGSGAEPLRPEVQGVMGFSVGPIQRLEAPVLNGDQLLTVSNDGCQAGQHAAQSRPNPGAQTMAPILPQWTPPAPFQRHDSDGERTRFKVVSPVLKKS